MILSVVDRIKDPFERDEKQGICIKVFTQVFPQYFDIDPLNYKFPEDPKERKAVIKLLLFSDPNKLKSLNLSQLSVEEILDLFPQEKMHFIEKYKYLKNFEHLGLIERLNKQTSSEEFFHIFDKMVKNPLVSSCLAQNISKVNVDCLSSKEIIAVYNKINFLDEDIVIDDKNLPFNKVINELKKIENPSELALQLEEFFLMGDGQACNTLISKIIKDRFFSESFLKLNFEDKFLLAQKVCACKLPENSIKELQEMIDGLQLEDQLEKITTSREYLILCHQIISLGEPGISSNFFTKLIHDERKEISLSIEDKLLAH